MPNIAILSTAHIHTKSFIEEITNATDGRRVAAIWDDVPERGQKYADMASAPFVEDLAALLANPQVDGLIICAENTRHLPLLQKVLPLGKPVFCEKPLVTNTSDLAIVRDILSTVRSPLFCGYFQPFMGDLQAIARLIDEGALGSITHASYINAHHAAYGRWFDNADLAWFCQPELAGGGALMDMGTHAIHLLRTLFGPVNEVWAEVANLSANYPDVDDYGVVHLRFSSGILGRAEAAWIQTGGVGGLTVTGSKACIWNTAEGYVIGRPDSTPEKIAPLECIPNRVDRLVATIRKEIKDQDLEADLAATIDTVTIMESAYRSAASGAWVRSC